MRAREPKLHSAILNCQPFKATPKLSVLAKTMVAAQLESLRMLLALTCVHGGEDKAEVQRIEPAEDIDD